MKQDFVEEINSRLSTNFKVTKIPVTTLKEFKQFCKEECGDVYWVGISQLLKIKSYSENLLTLFSNYQTQIDELKKQIQQLNSGEEKKQIKTFGKK